MGSGGSVAADILDDLLLCAIKQNVVAGDAGGQVAEALACNSEVYGSFEPNKAAVQVSEKQVEGNLHIAHPVLETE